MARKKASTELSELIANWEPDTIQKELIEKIKPVLTFGSMLLVGDFMDATPVDSGHMRSVWQATKAGATPDGLRVAAFVLNRDMTEEGAPLVMLKNNGYFARSGNFVAPTMHTKPILEQRKQELAEKVIKASQKLIEERSR